MVYGRTFNTMLKLYTDFRNIIRELDTKNSQYALEFPFSLGDKDITKGVFGYKAVKRRAGLTKKKELSLEDDTNEVFVKKMETFKDFLKERIDNNNFSDIKSNNQTEDTVKFYLLTMFLGITTGRRMIEILKTIELSIKGGTINYKGFAKKSDEEANEWKSGYLLFIEPNDAKKYLKMLRNLIDTEDMTAKDINRKYSNVLNSALNRYAGDIFGKKLKFHDLRGYYARYAYIKYGNNGVVGDFITEALHHTVPLTTKSSEHYDKWRNE